MNRSYVKEVIRIRETLDDFTPFRTFLTINIKKPLILFFSPNKLLIVLIEVVDPSLPALLSSSV